MSRLSNKQILQGERSNVPGLPSDFNQQEILATLDTKGYKVIHEKAYKCPCKSRESEHRNTCKNCGGSGWLFLNPTYTSMIITGIAQDYGLKASALQEWGSLDMGSVKVTSYNSEKLVMMDRITIVDATAEHQEILYPKLTDDGTQLFAYTKYDIGGFSPCDTPTPIDYIALFVAEDQTLKKLEINIDYTFRDNVIIFDSQYNNLIDPCVTIRYTYNPSFHITDVIRESMTSPANQGTEKLILPVHAIAKRAHLVKDVENFDGNRLLNNSWKANSCSNAEEDSKFIRQLKYSSVNFIYENLTQSQISALSQLIG